MKHKGLALAILIAAVLLTGGLVSAAPFEGDDLALVQVPWRDADDLRYVEASRAVVYARLRGDAGPYLLAGATGSAVEQLEAGGLDVQVLDPHMAGASYYLVYPLTSRPVPAWSAYGSLLLDDGVQVLLRTSPADATRLARAGVRVRALTLDPKPLPPAADGTAFPSGVEPRPFVQAMIEQVDPSLLYSYTGDLSGAWPVEVAGEPYTITTRYTYSGEPIEKATQLAGAHLSALGLEVEYHVWQAGQPPNVVGELRGHTHADDVILVGAHLDSITFEDPMRLAPGADDNASGSAAVLMAADILSQYRWGCSLRFALWTGEEQGMLGSQAYARRAHDGGENLLGVLNLDMIAWDSIDGPDIDLHADEAAVPASMQLAGVFSDVVDAYDLALIPQIIPAGTGLSDHASFWDYGYAAILGIEDYYPGGQDFTPYYHSEDDVLQHLNMDYFSEFVRGAVGTLAHMGCLLPHGALTGQVTDAVAGSPIASATVTLRDATGYAFSTTTGAAGRYSATLLAGTYTLTASADGYLAGTVPGVAVVADLPTLQDVGLAPVPVIQVEPGSLAARLSPGGTVSQTLWIRNAGRADLTFALHELGRPATRGVLDLGWLSETPASGWLAPGAGGAVRVTFDAGGLGPGVSLGLLVVESNDPARPRYEVPVTLTVEARVYLPLVVRGG